MTTIETWREQGAVRTTTSVHLNHHAQFKGEVRNRQTDGTPYAVLSIEGPHGTVDIFIEYADVLTELMVTILATQQDFAVLRSTAHEAGVAA